MLENDLQKCKTVLNCKKKHINLKSRHNISNSFYQEKSILDFSSVGLRPVQRVGKRCKLTPPAVNINSVIEFLIYQENVLIVYIMYAKKLFSCAMCVHPMIQ